MSFFMQFSICYLNMAVVSNLSIQFDRALKTGGPVIVVSYWLGTSLMNIIIGLSLAEISSTYPVTGSVYYWSGVLAKKGWGPLFGYICGWFNLLGNIANNAAIAYAVAGICSSIYSLHRNGHSTINTEIKVAIAIVILAFQVLRNKLTIQLQSKMNEWTAVFQILMTFALVVVLFAAVSHLSSAKFVFTRFYNDTGFEGDFYASLLGFLTPLYS